MHKFNHMYTHICIHAHKHASTCLHNTNTHSDVWHLHSCWEWSAEWSDLVTTICWPLSGPNKHQSAVTCLQFNKKFVITSSDDGTVKIWDLKTGEFLRNLVALDSGGSGGVVWRLRCNNTKLVCAVGSRNGTEETKLMVLDFDVEEKKVSWGMTWDVRDFQRNRVFLCRRFSEELLWCLRESIPKGGSV